VDNISEVASRKAKWPRCLSHLVQTYLLIYVLTVLTVLTPGWVWTHAW